LKNFFIKVQMVQSNNIKKTFQHSPQMVEPVMVVESRRFGIETTINFSRMCLRQAQAPDHRWLSIIMVVEPVPVVEPVMVVEPVETTADFLVVESRRFGIETTINFSRMCLRQAQAPVQRWLNIFTVVEPVPVVEHLY